MKRHLLILEDDADRRERFEHVAGELGLTVRFWHNAHEMIDNLAGPPAECAVISLDCDLIPPSGDDTWGDGVMVARHLATLPPFAPVIVHTTNRQGCDQMTSLLRDAGWSVHRVAPIGDDWIEHDWRMEIKTLLRGTAG